MTEADQDLLELFREGDSEAFEKIVSSYQDRLMGFFYRYCWDRPRSEDLVQEVFIRMIRAAHRYQPSGKLTTFVFKIARNLWIDQTRRKKVRPGEVSLDKPVGDDGATLGSLCEGESPNPVANILSHEEKDLLRTSLEDLSKGQRSVFELAVYQELPYKEISQILDVPVGTIKSRMFHALKALKGKLAPNSSGDEGGYDER